MISFARHFRQYVESNRDIYSNGVVHNNIAERNPCVEFSFFQFRDVIRTCSITYSTQLPSREHSEQMSLLISVSLTQMSPPAGQSFS